MAIAANSSVASLMQRALDRQNNLARLRFKLEPNKVKQILLAAFQNKNMAPYNELVSVLREWQINDENMLVLLNDLSESIVLLGREARSLVEVVCLLQWANRCSDIVSAFSRWIIDLVTAHNYHAQLVLTSLIKLFRDGDDEVWLNEPPEHSLILWSNVHNVIAGIVAIMPMSSDVLLHAIIAQYPYHKAGCYQNRAYVHNLLWITKYIPSLVESIATVIVTRMIIMDVNSKATNTKDETSKIESEIFSMELDEKQENNVNESLDYCMLEMLAWLQDERHLALETICSVFERVILPTHGTRHVQFLLLYTISISQKCADRVLNNLWSIAAGLHNLGPGAVSTRRIAASHLAGLLARTLRLSNTRLIEHLKSMSSWCHSYITAVQETSSQSDNFKVHGAFYAICHALFYLVAFKHQQLFSSKEALNFVESLNLPRLVTCSLNPLRLCCPTVVRAFTSVTRAHQVVYCQPILEKISRYNLTGETQTYSDEWFPYDPYDLPLSGKLIWPLCIEYREWRDNCHDDTQSSRVNKLEAEDDFLETSPSTKLACSFSMGTSPGFKYL